jgi:serralysin
MCWICLAAAQDSVADGARFVADAPAETAARFHVTLSGNQAVDGLQSGYAWAANDPLSFGFADSAGDYETGYANAEPTRGFAAAGANLQAAVRAALVGAPGQGAGPSVTGFTNLAILETEDHGAADIRVARSSAPSTAWAHYPNAREGGDAWFGTRHDFNGARLGNYAFLVAIHEIGHSLGLKHGHEAMGGFGTVPLDQDSLEFSVMSYRSKQGASTSGGYTNGTFDYPQSWMPLDIAALQQMYGADYGFRAGDKRYAWNPDTGETFVDGVGQGAPGANRIFLTLWDGGGRDTFDASNYAGGVAIDLAPGAHSTLSRTQLAVLDTRDGTQARGNLFNALLHQGNQGSLIEAALGGDGADTLSGNDAANLLEGGAGADLLRGRNGDDVLVGGAGDDTMEGGAGDDRFHVDSAGDQVREGAGGGLDTLMVETAATIILPAEVEVLRLGTAGRHAIGNEGANLLVGNQAANRLEGLGGADMLEGGRGNDTLVGGAGADRFVLRRGDGIDRIEDFAPGQDRLSLLGFGLSVSEVLGRMETRGEGVWLDLGGGDGVLLAGMPAGRMGGFDLIL